MTAYRLKPLAVDAFTWTGQLRASWPDWVSAVVLGIVSDGACLIVARPDNAFIVRVNDTLVRGADGNVYSLDPVALAAQIDMVADVVTPSPSPAPAAALPQQPYEPVDHTIINGVDNVVYFATGSVPFGKQFYMPAAEWVALNPAVTTGLH